MYGENMDNNISNKYDVNNDNGDRDNYCITIYAKGHPNVQSTHKTTLEITKEDYLTPTGDCIIGICADKSMIDFSEEFKNELRKSDKIIVEIIVGDLKETIIGKGHKDLILNHPTDIVIRKSNFICPRIYSKSSHIFFNLTTSTCPGAEALPSIAAKVRIEPN
ncbi:MAG: uncharacterized protein PWQ47_379 [Methanothermococcus sp.]|nr:uncharacterized protein [Methanothermococcus sp.]